MKLALALVGLLAASAAAQGCGQRNTFSRLSDLLGQSGDTYIVGGTEARRNEFPWQISIQNYYSTSEREPKKWRHNCGGSIINDQWLVTAAHCNSFSDLNDYRIIAGAHNIAREELGTQTLSIDKVVVHPSWDEDTDQNDIMLVKINGKFKLDGVTTAPVCLPTAEESKSFDDATCVTSGWGRTSDDGVGSDVLLKVDLPIVSRPLCALRYRNVNNTSITDKMICAGRVDTDGFGTCSGDSGGPLTCFKDGEYKLTGITSFGVDCGSSDHPTVFTRVAEYRTWIDKVLTDDQVLGSSNYTMLNKHLR